MTHELLIVWTTGWFVAFFWGLGFGAEDELQFSDWLEFVGYLLFCLAWPFSIFYIFYELVRDSQ